MKTDHDSRPYPGPQAAFVDAQARVRALEAQRDSVTSAREDRRLTLYTVCAAVALWTLIAYLYGPPVWAAANGAAATIQATWTMPDGWAEDAKVKFHMRVDITGPNGTPARQTKRTDIVGTGRTGSVNFTDLSNYPPESRLWGAVKTCPKTGGGECSDYVSVTTTLGTVEEGGGGGGGTPTVIIIVPAGIEIEIQRRD